jgi:hypothetical protein
VDARLCIAVPNLLIDGYNRGLKKCAKRTCPTYSWGQFIYVVKINFLKILTSLVISRQISNIIDHFRSKAVIKCLFEKCVP